MQYGDGQRQRDSHDSWAPFVVRPAYRKDPDDHSTKIDLIVCGLAIAIITLVFVGVHFIMPSVR